MAIIYGKPSQTVYGTNAADELHLNGPAVAYGGLGNDVIFDGAGNNRLYGQDGDDTLYSRQGHDELWGGRGNDQLYAGASFDSVRLYGEAGNDTLTGGTGNDTIDGGDGNDTIRSFGGVDYLRGGPGDDTIYFGDDVRFPGSGQIDGGSGYDTLRIYAGTFLTPIEITMTGESQGNLAYAKGTDDPSTSIRLTFTGINQIINGDSSDGDRAIVFHGGGNSDTVVTGGSHDDVFIGGDGYDNFTGLGGNDRFVFQFDNVAEHPGRLAMGHDTIMDFVKGSDSLSFQGGEGQMTTTQTEHDGMTTFDSYDLHGNLIHELDILGVVGLPPIGHDFIA